MEFTAFHDVDLLLTFAFANMFVGILGLSYQFYSWFFFNAYPVLEGGLEVTEPQEELSAIAVPIPEWQIVRPIADAPEPLSDVSTMLQFYRQKDCQMESIMKWRKDCLAIMNIILKNEFFAGLSPIDVQKTKILALQLLDMLCKHIVSKNLNFIQSVMVCIVLASEDGSITLPHMEEVYDRIYKIYKKKLELVEMEKDFWIALDHYVNRITPVRYMEIYCNYAGMNLNDPAIATGILDIITTLMTSTDSLTSEQITCEAVKTALQYQGITMQKHNWPIVV